MKENTWCARLSILRQILMFRSTNRKFKTGNDSITNHSRYFVQFRIERYFNNDHLIEIYKLNISCLNSFPYKIQDRIQIGIFSSIDNNDYSKYPEQSNPQRNNLFPRLDRKFNQPTTTNRTFALLSYYPINQVKVHYTHSVSMQNFYVKRQVTRPSLEKGMIL